MDFPDPNYQIDLSIFADFSFIFQNEKKWKCAKEFLQRCKIVGVSPKEFMAILTPSAIWAVRLKSMRTQTWVHIQLSSVLIDVRKGKKESTTPIPT